MANYPPSDDVDQQLVTTWRDDVTARVFPVADDEEMGPPMTYACFCYDFVIETVLMGALCLFGFAGNSVSMTTSQNRKHLDCDVIIDSAKLRVDRVSVA